LVSEVRCRLRQKAAPAPATTRRHLASRRSIHPNPRRVALSVACGGLARRRATFWCRTGEMAPLPSAFSSTCYAVCSTSHGTSSRMGCVATASLNEQSCPMSGIAQAGILNNRAENSHRPTRPGERQMQKLKSGSQAQQYDSSPVGDPSQTRMWLRKRRTRRSTNGIHRRSRRSALLDRAISRAPPRSC
jgi:hypothetical protein